MTFNNFTLVSSIDSFKSFSKLKCFITFWLIIIYCKSNKRKKISARQKLRNASSWKEGIVILNDINTSCVELFPLLLLGVVRKLRHAKNEFLTPLPTCHKFSKERKILCLDRHKFLYSLPPKRDVICERPLMEMRHILLWHLQ